MSCPCTYLLSLVSQKPLLLLSLKQTALPPLALMNSHLYKMQEALGSILSTIEQDMATHTRDPSTIELEGGQGHSQAQFKATWATRVPA